MEDIEQISLIDFKEAFGDVERHMDIWDWLVYNGYVTVETDTPITKRLPLELHHPIYNSINYVPYGHSKYLVCGEIHPDGLPCPEMKIT